MAKTPAEIAALADYTSAEMAKLIRWAIAELASNPDQATVTVAGRQWGQQDLAKLEALERHYLALAAADTRAALTAAGGGSAVVQFGGPQP